MSERETAGSIEMPKMTSIGCRKLQDLQAQGWMVDGVSISRTKGDQTDRGLVTAGGMVCWWTSDAAMEAYAETAVDRDRKRIKDGILALAMTAEKIHTDADAVDTARKALALRVSTLVDGHGDLVMNDAGKRLMAQLQDAAAPHGPATPTASARSDHFKLITQKPRPKELGTGVLSIDKSGEAMFFEGNGESAAQLLASMQRVRIEFAGATGIMLSGMQPEGFERNGTQKFAYQEWWLIYSGAPA